MCVFLFRLTWLTARVGLRRISYPCVLGGLREGLHRLYRGLVSPSRCSCFFLWSPDIDPRVTIPGGVQDQAAVALSRGKLRSSSQVLPTVHIRSRYPNLPHLNIAHQITSSTSSQKDVCVHERSETTHGRLASDRRRGCRGRTIQRRACFEV